jgi:hypothetical protein
MRRPQKILLLILAVILILALIFRLISRGRKPMHLAQAAQMTNLEHGRHEIHPVTQMEFLALRKDIE